MKKTLEKIYSMLIAIFSLIVLDMLLSVYPDPSWPQITVMGGVGLITGFFFGKGIGRYGS